MLFIFIVICPEIHLANGHVRYSTHLVDGRLTVGTTAYHSCNRNFSFSGYRRARECEAGGGWTSSKVTCARRCEHFDIQHGSELYSQYELGNGGYNPGTIVVFSCDSGYTLESDSGHDYNRCNYAAYWEFIHPECIKGNRKIVVFFLFCKDWFNKKKLA